MVRFGGNLGQETGTWIPPRWIEELAYTKLLSQLHGSGSILVSIIRDRLRFTGQIDHGLINIYN